MSTATLFIIFVFSFFAGAYLTSVVEDLIKKHRAKKRYYAHLEKENKRLKSTVAFLLLEQNTKEDK